MASTVSERLVRLIKRRLLRDARREYPRSIPTAKTGLRKPQEAIQGLAMMRPAIFGAVADGDEGANAHVRREAESGPHSLGIESLHRRGLVAAFRRCEQQIAERDGTLLAA